MPRFFFDFLDAGALHQDSLGTELSGIEGAEAEAIESLVEMAGGTQRPVALRVDVRDERGNFAAQECGMCIELAMFSQESWHDGIRLSPKAADLAVASLAKELQAHRNVALQIWNEFSERAIEHVDSVKSIDPARLVSNSCGYAGVLLAPPQNGALEAKLDYLSPHTSRQDRSAGRHWNVVPREIGLLVERFGKPVVDDEPARNGTSKHGGPLSATNPYDQILQIHAVWREKGHVIYHHDMFQTGAESAEVPRSGIPEPDFNPYHRQVLEFLALRDRYFNMYQAPDQ